MDLEIRPKKFHVTDFNWSEVSTNFRRFDASLNPSKPVESFRLLTVFGFDFCHWPIIVSSCNYSISTRVIRWS